MNKPDQPSKSVLYLIAAAVGWETLAFLPIILIRFKIVPFEGRGLLFEIPKLIGYGTVLLGAYIQGRIIGGGNVWRGLGYQPISPRPIVVLMAVLVAWHAILWDIIHYVYFRDLVYQQFVTYVANPWPGLALGFDAVVLAPLSEELFFRGWLWTGLRKHWGALPTGALTGAAWLGLHSPNIFLWLFPAAVMLSVARHFGQSVRASIALHMLYNFIVIISPLVLKAAGLL